MKDRGGEILAIGIAFLILSWLTVGLRCFVRIHMIKSFGIDDYTMLVTLLFFTGYLVSQIGGAVNGSGVRRIHLTDESAETALHFWFFCEIFYTLSTCMLKISVGFFLLRITIVPLQIWIIRLIMVVSGLVGIAYTSVVIFQCKPISYWWDLNPNAVGSCLSPVLVMNFTFVVSGLNAFADWVFAILPVLIVGGLHMKKRMKVVVASVIALAAIGSTATIIRLPYTTTIKGYKGDFLFRTTDFAIWSTVEVGLGISAGSIATLRPLLKQAFEITRSASSMPWSKPSLKSGQEQSGHQLSVIKPSIQKSITITTSRARRGSKESDEERFLSSSIPSEAWQQQQVLPGYITSTVLDEQAARASMDRSPKQGQKQNRKGSPGGTSQSTVESKESGNVPEAHVHERF